ncbi:sigma-70 family RNA polymerase sigma factor [bacterium]|nr:sigma-70 family RNA polymerase sigma factor [bacterium]
MPRNNIDKHNKLMLRFQSGDETAYRSLLGSYKNRVYGLMQRYFQNQSLAEQATRDVFLRVYAAKDSFQPESSFSLWLFTIVNQVCRNYPQDDTIEIKSMKKAQGREEQQILRQALSRFSREERIAFLLDHCEKLTIPEISDVLNKNPLAVETVLCRARANLRIKLAAYLETTVNS